MRPKPSNLKLSTKAGQVHPVFLTLGGTYSGRFER
jgi:hypothetical protein